MDKVVAYSFDVFDTCLIRTCGYPSAVFRLTALALKDVMPPQLITWSEDEFVIERARAERLVINEASSEEITLENIWIRLCEILEINFYTALPDIEQECERKVLRPNPEIFAKILVLREKGSRILFISDMYLPYDFVHKELIGSGFYRQGDRLYLSSALGIRKQSGNLYKYLLEKEGLSPKQLNHLGDNRKSDYQVPLGLGINANHYTSSEFTKLEERLLLLGQSNPQLLISLVSAMREYRLTSSSSGISELVGKFLAPVLVLFAQWVLQNAEKTGIKHLYFFSRDCQALAKVAAGLSEKDFGIECRYLLVSRQALFLPSASDCNRESMRWLIRNSEIPLLGSVLAKLELNSDEWLGRFQSLHQGAGASFIICSPEDKDKFWNILQEPDIRSVICEKIRERKTSAVDYFRTQGILDHKLVGVVDLGWHGTCQASLKKIIDSSGGNTSIHGFLLGMVRERLQKSQTGPIMALFTQKPIDDPSNRVGEPIFQHINKIEHILGLANHFSVHHYEDGRPIFQSPVNSFNEKVKQNVDYLHEELERFVNIYNSIRAEKQYLDDDLVRQSSALLLSEFWSNPNSESLSVFANVTASTCQNNLTQVALISPFTHVQALRQFLPSRYFGTPPLPGKGVVSWREASHQISPKTVKFLLNLRKFIRRKLV